MDIKAIAGKKVAGVPVIYLAGGAAAILGVIAWRMKPTEPEPEPVDAGSSGESGSGNGAANIAGDTSYDQFESRGTVIAAPTSPNAAAETEPDPKTVSNDAWARDRKSVV